MRSHLLSLPGLTRQSTSILLPDLKDVDARIKSGDDIGDRRNDMRVFLTVVTLSSLLATAAHAQSVGFQSPSRNIACQYFDYDKQNTLRCDIMEATVTVRRPADCDLEWGKAFEMRAKGGAVRLCYGDT